MIPTTSALPGSGVTLTGQGPGDFHQVRFPVVEGHRSGVGFFHSPGLYKGEHNGARGRREQTGDGRWRGNTFGTELRSKLRGEEDELLSGAGTRRRAQGQARGLSGDHRRERGVVEATARRSFAGASAVQSAHGRERQQFPSPIPSFELRERR